MYIVSIPDVQQGVLLIWCPTVFLSDAPSYNVFRIHRFIRPQVTRPDSRLGLMLRISGSPLRRVTKSGDDAGTFYNIPQPKVTTAVASRRRVADAKRELVRKSIGSSVRALKEASRIDNHHRNLTNRPVSDCRKEIRRCFGAPSIRN